MPENELWQLCRTAYEQYKSEIINGDKAYARYVNDWFYYHLPIMVLNEADMRKHFMHVHEIQELLEERRDLVDAFFSKDGFGKEDFEQMLDLFNTGKNIEPKNDFLAHFTDNRLHG